MYFNISVLIVKKKHFKTKKTKTKNKQAFISQCTKKLENKSLDAFNLKLN